MPRVIFAAREIDSDFQIEDGVRRTLQSNNTAQISASVIEANYELLDAKMEPLAGTFEDKCAAIAKSADATFEIRDETVWFRRKKRL